MPHPLGVLSGPSTNTFSMYSTTNSINHPRHKNISKARLPAGEKPVTGFHSNIMPSVGADGSLSGMKSENQRRFQQKHSIHGVYQEHSTLVRSPENVKVKVPKGATTGFRKNGNSFTPMEQIGARAEHHAIKDAKTLSDLKLSDPIAAENAGRGPDRFSTTNRSIHDSKPLQKEDRYRGPRDVSSLREGQKTSSLLSGGFKTNRIGTLPHGLPSNRETSYNATVGGGSYDKFFQRDKDSLQHAPGMLRTNQINKNNPHHISTGYKQSEYPATSIAQKTMKGYEAQREIDARRAGEELNLLKLSDPVMHDDITNRRGQFDTTSRIQYNEEKIQERPLKASQSLSSSGRTRGHTGGFANNNTTPFTMERQKGTTTSHYKASFKSDHSVHAERGFREQEKAPARRSAFTLNSPKPSDTKTANLSDTLQSHHEEAKRLHPAIKKRVEFSDPARYGNAVSTYAHKRRR